MSGNNHYERKAEDHKAARIRCPVCEAGPGYLCFDLVPRVKGSTRVRSRPHIERRLDWLENHSRAAK